jgi:glutaredoxin
MAPPCGAAGTFQSLCRHPGFLLARRVPGPAATGRFDTVNSSKALSSFKGYRTAAGSFHSESRLEDLSAGAGSIEFTRGQHYCRKRRRSMAAKVKMYTLSTCSHCKATKQFMNDNEVDYEYVDVDLLDGEDRTSIMEEVKKINSHLSFPTIIIGERIIIGFREEEIREVLGL